MLVSGMRFNIDFPMYKNFLSISPTIVEVPKSIDSKVLHCSKPLSAIELILLRSPKKVTHLPSVSVMCRKTFEGGGGGELSNRNLLKGY